MGGALNVWNPKEQFGSIDTKKYDYDETKVNLIVAGYIADIQRTEGMSKVPQRSTQVCRGNRR